MRFKLPSMFTCLLFVLRCMVLHNVFVLIECAITFAALNIADYSAFYIRNMHNLHHYSSFLWYSQSRYHHFAELTLRAFKNTYRYFSTLNVQTSTFILRVCAEDLVKVNLRVLSSFAIVSFLFSFFLKLFFFPYSETIYLVVFFFFCSSNLFLLKKITL